MDAQTLSPSDQAADKRFFIFNAFVSVAALSLLGYLLLLRDTGASAPNLRFMPALNAGLNATATTLLVGGFIAIKKKRPDIHKYFMVGAFAASALFLVGYLIYHYVHGDTRYPGTGVLRGIYLAILASHVLLSMIAFPMILSTFYFSYRKNFARHRKLARFTFPIWLYVSVTGVVIFFMLRAAGA